MNMFSHSGDIGDIIYALPTIKAKGGGELVLFNYPGRTYQPMTEKRYLTMKPLLDYQSYIFKSRFSELHEDTSLNGFRHHTKNGENCSDWHLCTHGLDWKYRIEKWLSVPEPIFKNTNIMAWTPRHHSFNFPWNSIVDKYDHDLGFLGYEEYYNEFCNKYKISKNRISYIEADNFLLIAQIIEASSLYIGNLTSITAVAEGLKKKSIIEAYHSSRANDFVRHNSMVCYTERIEI